MGERPKNPFERPPRAPRRTAATATPVVEPARRAGIRRLPSDLVDLADGVTDKLRRRPRTAEPLDDDRVGYVIPGVRNLDARAVYDARVDQLRAAVQRKDEVVVAQGLCEAVRLTLWRARNVTDFEAFADSVVGISPERAQQLAREGAERMGVTLEMLPAHVAALWLRIEAALLRVCPDGRAAITGRGQELCVEVKVPTKDLGRAVEGFFDVGNAAAGLRRFLRAEGSRGATRTPPPADRGRDRERPRPRTRPDFEGGRRPPKRFRER